MNTFPRSPPPRRLLHDFRVLIPFKRRTHFPHFFRRLPLVGFLFLIRHTYTHGTRALQPYRSGGLSTQVNTEAMSAVAENAPGSRECDAMRDGSHFSASIRKINDF